MDCKLIIVCLVMGSALASAGIIGKYRKTGNHYGDEGDSLSDFKGYINTMISEWEQLVGEQDAVDIARKYSTDSIWIHPVFGRITTEAEVQEAYETLFDIGVTSVKETPLGSAYIGDNYAYLLATQDWRNKDGKTIFVSEVLIIFRQLKEGGFQVLFKSEDFIDEKDALKLAVRSMLLDL